MALSYDGGFALLVIDAGKILASSDHQLVPFGEIIGIARRLPLCLLGSRYCVDGIEAHECGLWCAHCKSPLRQRCVSLCICCRTTSTAVGILSNLGKKLKYIIPKREFITIWRFIPVLPAPTAISISLSRTTTSIEKGGCHYWFVFSCSQRSPRCSPPNRD